MNPTPDATRTRSTSIAGADAQSEEVEGLLALAQDCSLSLDDARERMRHVAAAMVKWREQARRNKIAEGEITMMAESVEPRLEAVAAAGRVSK